MMYMISEKLLTLIIGALYLLGVRYLLGLGSIENDLDAIQRFLKRRFNRFTSILYWYQPRELIHQLRGLRIVHTLG